MSYTKPTITGYNTSPPADDGSATEANKVKWSTIKGKLTDPAKTYADDINNAVDAAFTNLDFNTYDSKAAAVLVTPTNGVLYYIGGTDGGFFKGITGAAPGTYADDGGNYCGTVFIPTGGDGSACYQRIIHKSLDVRWFGATGDASTDDTAAVQAAITLAVTAADPNTYSALTPYNGVLPVIDFPAGVFLVDTLTVAGSVYLRGTMLGSYAGTVFKQKTDGQSIIYLDADTDSNSNASVFEGIRFKSGSATSSDVEQIEGNDSLTGINSIRFINCWFQAPEKYAVTVVGDDWMFESCTFDVSAYGFIRLGTASRAATNTKFVGCTYFDVSTWTFTAINAARIHVIGGTVYGSGGFSSGGTTQSGNFYNNQNNTHAVGGCLINGVQIDDVSQVAQTNKLNFKMVNCFGSNVGGTSKNIIGIGGGSEMQGYDISNNEFYTVGSCTGIDMTSTALTRSRIKNNTFRSNDGLGTRGFNISDTRNDNNDFSGNMSFDFLNADVFVNHPLNKISYRKSTSTIDPPSISAGAVYTTTETFTGARAGDTVHVSSTTTWPVDDGIIVTAYVSASDTVTLRYTNATSGAINPAAHQLILSIIPTVS